MRGFVDGELILRNQTESEKVIEIKSPHPTCASYILTPIDF